MILVKKAKIGADFSFLVGYLCHYLLLLPSNVPNQQAMNVKNTFQAFFGMLARMWKALFYTFSAFMLYAVIAVGIHLIMNALGASGKAIDATLIVFSVLVALYVMGKGCYCISRWLRGSRHPEQEELDTQTGESIRDRKRTPISHPYPQKG